MREGGREGGREEKRGGDRCYIKEECVPRLGLKSIAVRSVCLRHDANADTPSRHIVNRWERTRPSSLCPPAHLAVMEQEGNDLTVSPPQTLSTPERLVFLSGLPFQPEPFVVWTHQALLVLRCC